MIAKYAHLDRVVSRLHPMYYIFHVYLIGNIFVNGLFVDCIGWRPGDMEHQIFLYAPYTTSVVRKYLKILTNNEVSSGAWAQGVTGKSTGCGFDRHSRK